MKKLMLIAALVAAAFTSASGQKLMIGEKAPELKIKEWLNGNPPQGKVRLTEFFHTTNTESMQRLDILDGYKDKFGGELTVIIISGEDVAVVKKAVLAKPRSFSVGIDDNSKTFNSYTQYIPFSVLTDQKGKVIWFGNPRNLQESIVSDALK